MAKTHLLIEEHIDSPQDDDTDADSSALVLWQTDANGDKSLLLPKRYFLYKHFSTLSGKGYKRIKNNQTGSNSNLWITSFISPDNNKLVLPTTGSPTLILFSFTYLPSEALNILSPGSYISIS